MKYYLASYLFLHIISSNKKHDLCLPKSTWLSKGRQLSDYIPLSDANVEDTLKHLSWVGGCDLSW